MHSSAKGKARALNQLCCRRCVFVPEAPDLKQTLPGNLCQQKLRIWRPLDPATRPFVLKANSCQSCQKGTTNCHNMLWSLFVHWLLLQDTRASLKVRSPCCPQVSCDQSSRLCRCRCKPRIGGHTPTIPNSNTMKLRKQNGQRIGQAEAIFPPSRVCS